MLLMCPNLIPYKYQKNYYNPLIIYSSSENFRECLVFPIVKLKLEVYYSGNKMIQLKESKYSNQAQTMFPLS